jgi:hypothetical protein
MKKISATRGPIILKGMATIMLIIVTIVSIKESAYFMMIPAVLFAAIAYFKNPETVYIDKNDFVVRGKKILITDVISIRKDFIIPIYRVRYYDKDDNIKSFKLEIDSFMHINPEFMKKLQALAKKNNHNTSLL